MPRTTLTPDPLIAPSALGSVSANALDCTMTAGDVANGNDVTWTGDRLILVLWNSGASPYYVTLTAAADDLGRAVDVTQYDIGADEHVVLVLPRRGWQQSDGTLYVDVENAAILIGAVAL